jgi:hypothetical protein
MGRYLKSSLSKPSWPAFPPTWEAQLEAHHRGLVLGQSSTRSPPGSSLTRASNPACTMTWPRLTPAPTRSPADTGRHHLRPCAASPGRLDPAPARAPRVIQDSSPFCTHSKHLISRIAGRVEARTDLEIQSNLQQTLKEMLDPVGIWIQGVVPLPPRLLDL